MQYWDWELCGSPVVRVRPKWPAPESLKGTETILVVDDDAAVALVVRRILENQGYTVMEASGGEEALRRFGDLEKLFVFRVCQL